MLFRSESWSVFGQGTLNLSDAFRIIGSLRYSHTSKDGDFAARLVYGPFAIRPISSAKGSIREGNVDPSTPLQYDIAPRVMVYATPGPGSKQGGFVTWLTVVSGQT